MVAVLVVVLCVVALIDGGEEPLHPIEQAVVVPGVTR